MDLQQITEVTELKALAYDTLQALELQQNNLRLIQQRIAEVEQETQSKKK